MKKEIGCIVLTSCLLFSGCQFRGASAPALSGPVDSFGTLEPEASTVLEETVQITAPEQLQLPILDEIDENVQIGTAGAFLTAVKVAADMLDWGVNTGLDTDEVFNATVVWLSGRGNDAQVEFSEKLEQVDAAYKTLLEDNAEDLLSTAGVENSGYPWGTEPVAPIEAIMEAVGLR